MFVLLGGEEWREWKLPLSLSVRSEFTRRMDNSAAVQTIWQICWILLTGTKSSCEKKEKPLPDGMTMSGGGGRWKVRGKELHLSPLHLGLKGSHEATTGKFLLRFILCQKEKRLTDPQQTKTLCHDPVPFFALFFCFGFIYLSENSLVMISVENVERINHKIIHIKM